MPQETGIACVNVITASAERTLTTPVAVKKQAYSNKIELGVKNINSFSSQTTFEIYVNGNYVKTYNWQSLKKKNLIEITDDGNLYLNASKTYTIIVRAVNGDSISDSSPLSVKTAAKTYYTINKNVQLFTFKNGKVAKSSKTKKSVAVSGTLTTAKNKRVAGKSKTVGAASYVLLKEGDYKGKYVKVGKGVSRTPERKAKIKTAVDYAASMNGGRYVWGGTRYKATDCCGLTMQAYKKAGVNMTNSVYAQAKMGKAVSMKNIQAGDLIICNNYGHVAMYIGGGKIVHAMNTYYGIRIQPISRIKYCGKINTIRRIL
ncbi:C40 family peptidase [uncultured Ruminococcus sp.]|uniref:C40 family peptidase n=1 Tax=uncultured Ruminococcus sp. TaxID=165186 RepID=UPI0025F8E082|nr:C40 family peptidase [uncultured Ruminococcus sp.]